MNNDDSGFKSWLFSEPTQLAIKGFLGGLFFGLIATTIVVPTVFDRYPAEKIIGEGLLVAFIGAIIVYLMAKQIEKEKQNTET
jgi:uncharacterized membrane protein YeaQ/YmgE (transglycosylase-associated protein family)